MSIKNCHNIRDFRARAKRALPSPMYHYLDGGADDEWSLGNNTDAFNGYELRPHALVDVSQIDLGTRLFGQKMAMPLFLSPIGGVQMFHPGKELAVARAAAAAGVFTSLSTVGTTGIEEFSSQTDGPKLFQLYIFKDRGLTRELVARCKAADIDALCLTVDTPVGGNRERDLLTGMSVPPKFTGSSLLSFALHPRWALNTKRAGAIRMANVADWLDAKEDTAGGGAAAFIDAQFDQSVTWDDAASLAHDWNGPFIIKGIMTPEDAIRARDVGASAVMISNHGGRQLDGAPAPVDMVGPIRDAVGDTLELIVDGGVRRGTHVLKALALGANACSIGRPFIYGLAAGGQAGVARVLSLFEQEIKRDMALLGCNSISQINAGHVQRRIT